METVLVVDDEPVVRDLVARYLEREGYGTIQAEDGDVARDLRRVFSRDQLMDRVWGYTTALDTGTVTVHVRRLREKIEPDPSRPRHLQTVWGVGYRFSP